MSELLEVNHVSYAYHSIDGETETLADISFHIKEGEFAAIVGPSGCGKSTLLSLICGLLKPEKGEILLDGKSIAGEKERIGYMLQKDLLLPYKTIEENVALPLTFRGEPRKERIKKADRMLDLVSLEKHKKHLPNQLSGGQQQRVSVARALVNDPKIIFADEPTGALDSHTSQDVMRLMQRLVREQKRTLVMVTHDRSQAEYADRVLEIIDGKIVHITENRRKEENERA